RHRDASKEHGDRPRGRQRDENPSLSSAIGQPAGLIRAGARAGFGERADGSWPNCLRVSAERLAQPGLDVVHISSFRSLARAAMPREAVDETVPLLIPSVAAMSASARSR